MRIKLQVCKTCVLLLRSMKQRSAQCTTWLIIHWQQLRQITYGEDVIDIIVVTIKLPSLCERETKRRRGNQSVKSDDLRYTSAEYRTLFVYRPILRETPLVCQRKGTAIRGYDLDNVWNILFEITCKNVKNEPCR